MEIAKAVKWDPHPSFRKDEKIPVVLVMGAPRKGKSTLLNAIVDPDEELSKEEIVFNKGDENRIRCATIEGSESNLIGTGQAMTLCDMPGFSHKKYRGASRFLVERALQLVIERCGHITKILMVHSRIEALAGEHIMMISNLLLDLKVTLMTDSNIDDKNATDLLGIVVVMFDHYRVSEGSRKQLKREFKRVFENGGKELYEKELSDHFAVTLKDEASSVIAKVLPRGTSSQCQLDSRCFDTMNLFPTPLTLAGVSNYRPGLQSLVESIALMSSNLRLVKAPSLSNLENDMKKRLSELEKLLIGAKHQLEQSKLRLNAHESEFRSSWPKIAKSVYRFLPPFVAGQFARSALLSGIAKSSGQSALSAAASGAVATEAVKESVSLTAHALSFGAGVLMGAVVTKAMTKWDESSAKELIFDKGYTLDAFREWYLAPHEENKKAKQDEVEKIENDVESIESALAFVVNLFEPRVTRSHGNQRL